MALAQGVPPGDRNLDLLLWSLSYSRCSSGSAGSGSAASTAACPGEVWKVRMVIKDLPIHLTRATAFSSVSQLPFDLSAHLLELSHGLFELLLMVP